MTIRILYPALFNPTPNPHSHQLKASERPNVCRIDVWEGCEGLGEA